MSKVVFIILLSLVLVLLAGYLFIQSRNKDIETSKFILNENNSMENSSVPLPTKEDVIRKFFNLINEERIPEAINMMEEDKMDDSTKQAWGVQFNNIEAISVLSIEKVNLEDTSNRYKVSLDVKMSQESANALIPYFGWEGNPNIRFITLIKVGDLWKIREIATGP